MTQSPKESAETTRKLLEMYNRIPNTSNAVKQVLKLLEQKK